MTAQIEKHTGIVVSTDDPKKLGMISVKCPHLTSDPEMIVEGVLPALDWGWFYVPDVNEEVELECIVDDDGDEMPGETFLMTPDFRWRGKRFFSIEGKGPRPPDEIFTKENYGKRRGFATPTGPVLMFDDTKGSEKVLLSWMDPKTEKTNQLEFSQDGVKATDQFENVIEMSDGLIKVTGANTVQVEAAHVDIKSGDVLVGDGADSPFVRHVEWEAWATAHQHLTVFGLSSPPTVPPTPTIASTTSKVA